MVRRPGPGHGSRPPGLPVTGASAAPAPAGGLGDGDLLDLLSAGGTTVNRFQPWLMWRNGPAMTTVYNLLRQTGTPARWDGGDTPIHVTTADGLGHRLHRRLCTTTETLLILRDGDTLDQALTGTDLGPAGLTVCGPVEEVAVTLVRDQFDRPGPDGLGAFSASDAIRRLGGRDAVLAVAGLACRP
jgi:hypothetical protein